MKRQPTIEWQVCGACNYDCSYCIQSKKHRKGHPSDAEIDALMRFFAALPRRFEIKMSGGEPFAFRGFLGRIVPELVARTPHVLSVLTNLSAGPAELERFASLTRGRLGIVSASLHLESVDIPSFVEKARGLRRLLDPETRLVVNAVLVPGRLELVERARAALAEAGLDLFPQVMKTKTGVFEYDEQDRVRLRTLLGEAPTPRSANTAPSYRGLRCWAGADYFVLTQRGEAFSCRTAKRFGEGHLGSVLDGGVTLRSGPEPCSYDICPCTVPANRGMIEGLGS